MARVINGAVVRPRYKYPWIIPFMLENDLRTFVCSGGLISSTFVLLAAHCFLDESQKDYPCNKKGAPSYCYLGAETMRVGLMGKSHTEPKSIIGVKRVIIHPDYDADDNVADIALLEIEGEIRCNKYVSPICLPTKQLRTRDGQVTIAGWGRFYQDLDKIETQMLREGRVKHIDSRVCQNSNSREKDRRKIFCTIGLDGGNQTSCQGDSGSSVFAAFDDVFYSLGVTSIHTDGDRCPIDAPVTFINTVPYMDWIRKYVRNLPSPPGGHDES